jgi:thiol-disulfide isomerase/thioredoxin
MMNRKQLAFYSAFITAAFLLIFMRYSFSLTVGLALLALVLTVLSGQDAQPAHAAGGAAAQTLRTGGAHKSKAGAESAAPVVSEVDLEALKKLLQRGSGEGARPLLVNFWATWCEPCREEFPDLIKINDQYSKHNLELITVSLDDPADIKTTVPAFLREMRSTMPAYLLNVVDPDIVITMIDPEWHGALPATFLYDASGKMVFKHTGRFDTLSLRAAIDKVTDKVTSVK